jgi:hypothetical protein
MLLVGGALVISACGGSTASKHQGRRHASPTPAGLATRSLQVPKRQAGELARATVTPEGQTDVVRRMPAARRYAVRVACVASGPDAKAAYTVYDTDTTPARPQELTSGGFPCDGTEYENGVGRLHSGIQISFSRLPRHVAGGYAIVVPE